MRDRFRYQRVQRGHAIQREVLIEKTHLLPQQREHASSCFGFRACQTHHQRGPRAGAAFHLKHGIVNHRPRVGIEGGDVHIGGYADDREDIPASPVKSLADRIAAGKVLPDKGFIHDRHVRRPSSVLFGKFASSHNRDAHRAEITRAHQGIVRPVEIVFGRVFQQETDLANVAQRQVRRFGCADDSGHCGHTSQQFFLDILSAGRIGIPRLVEKSSGDEYAVRVESRGYGEQAEKTL